MESSRSRPTLKYNNLVETKPIEGSPRLSYLTNRLSNYIKGSTSRTPFEEHYYQTSPHQSILENNSNQADYMVIYEDFCMNRLLTDTFENFKFCQTNLEYSYPFFSLCIH